MVSLGEIMFKSVSKDEYESLMNMSELDEEKLRRAFQLEGTACEKSLWQEGA